MIYLIILLILIGFGLLFISGFNALNDNHEEDN